VVEKLSMLKALRNYFKQTRDRQTIGFKSSGRRITPSFSYVTERGEGKTGRRTGLSLRTCYHFAVFPSLPRVHLQRSFRLRVMLYPFAAVFMETFETS
jgi:hypothetical protein